MTLMAGGATQIVTCEVGDGLCGQLHDRISVRVRDDLEANAMYLSDGESSVMLIGVDVITLQTPYVRRVQQLIEQRTGIAARDVILCTTHTHAGPHMQWVMYDTPVNEAYLQRLEGWLVDVAADAVAAAVPARVGWGIGEAHVGFNRRMCWADGTHTMYGDATRPDFCGLEGPDDPAHAVLFATDAAGKVIAIAHQNNSHTTCVESDDFISSDFPGAARAALRRDLSSDVPVIYLQGFSGDTSPWDMLAGQTHCYDGEQRMLEMGEAMAVETLRLIEAAETTDSPVLSHAYEDVKIDVRLPSPERLAEVRAMQQDPAAHNRWDYVLAMASLKLYDDYKDDPVETVAINALRVGEFVMATCPAEIYCQFAHDIKRRSPSAVTATVQLADGYCGYIPTISGILGGGYSAEPILWSRLEPYAGYRVVDVAAQMINKVWTA